MIIRLMRRIFTAEVMGVLLIFLALQTLTYGLSASLRGTDTSSFLSICVLAALLCFGLYKAHWNGIQATVGIVALGVIGVWILGARLTGPLVDLGRAVTSLFPQIVPAIQTRTSLDTTAIAEVWEVIAQASDTLLLRLQTWVLGLNRNVTINDALIRNMVWTLIVWLCAAGMGWFAGRRQAMPALLPSITLLAFVISYSERRVESLWMMVFILILLMGVWNFKNQTVQWEKLKVDYSDSIIYDSGQAVVVFAILVGTLMFITPSISWQDLRDYWRERNTKNEAAEILGIQEQAAAPAHPTPKPALPREHLLDSTYAQSQQIVMTIRTGELPPIPDPSFVASPARYYWRSTVYDTYVGAGWVTGNSLTDKYNASTPLIPGVLDGYRLVHLDVNMVTPEGKLFWSGILFSVDAPITAGWRVRPTSDLFADQSALLAADMFAAATEADAYIADVYIPLADLTALRGASTEYPEEILERYLKLPYLLPDRVTDLAHEITDGLANPYDKAKAIETYLRENYPYDLEVPRPPEGQDVADYFLFDIKKGYCDYYATAMVVLARASGLPARFVSGYAPGAYDAPNAQYVVRELNAHSWAEVYFPQIGWIEFEPTASLPVIERTASEDIAVNPQPDDSASELLTRFRLARVGIFVLPFILAIVIAILYFTVIERWWYAYWLPPIMAIERIYRRLYRAGRPLAGLRTDAETSQEFSDKLVSALHIKQTTSRFKKLFKNSPYEIHTLTVAYHNSLFRQVALQKQDVRSAWRAWSKLRWQLWLARLGSSLQDTKHGNVKSLR